MSAEGPRTLLGGMQKPAIATVLKRDGRLVPFDAQKIRTAIEKAFRAVGRNNLGPLDKLTREVVRTLESRFRERTPSVEDVQDVVEQTLIQAGFGDVAKAYILYRRSRSEVRAAKEFFRVQDDLKLSVNAVAVLEKRYLLKNERGAVIETPSQLFRRVAHAVAAADQLYDSRADVGRTEEQFYAMMASLEFLPNSPCLMNAGTALGQLSACFVLPVEDSIEGIFDAIKYAARIHQTGGGTGFAFSRLRPRGDIVASTRGVSSGPVSFMRIFDMASETMKQGGRRRAANMGILRADHPDVLEFISAKTKGRGLENFNISLAATDEFMQAARDGGEYALVNPHTGEAVRKLRASDVMDMVVTSAWATGDPGLIFIDEINRYNATPHVGAIESTNPCGEQPLLPYESCILGSINVERVTRDAKIDWERLRELVRQSVHFLDNVIDANRYPIPQIEAITKANRKIGLGVMGFADLLIRLGIPYDSEEALNTARELMTFLQREGHAASRALAEERGAFPNFPGSRWAESDGKPLRNATVTTIAPTGTLSIIAGCSSGIEPLFAISFARNILEGTRLLEVNPLFEQVARTRGFYSRELMAEIARTGSVQHVPQIPEEVKRVFRTALDIAPEWHVRMQAAFQEQTDNAVSKTVNLPHEATVEDVRRIYWLAYELKCKGITVFRYGSKTEQVLYVGPGPTTESAAPIDYVSAASEYAGGCPLPVCNLN